jgi:hypothetical protein
VPSLAVGVVGILGGHRRPGVGELGEGIDRQRADIVMIDQIGELLRILVEVGVVLVDRLAQDREVVPQHRLARTRERVVVARHSD